MQTMGVKNCSRRCSLPSLSYLFTLLPWRPNSPPYLSSSTSLTLVDKVARSHQFSHYVPPNEDEEDCWLALECFLGPFLSPFPSIAAERLSPFLGPNRALNGRPCFLWPSRGHHLGPEIFSRDFIPLREPQTKPVIVTLVWRCIGEEIGRQFCFPESFSHFPTSARATVSSTSGALLAQRKSKLDIAPYHTWLRSNFAQISLLLFSQFVIKFVLLGPLRQTVE